MLIEDLNYLSAALKFKRQIENQLLIILGEYFLDTCLYACANEDVLQLNFSIGFLATCSPICQRREGLRNSDEKLAPRAEVTFNNYNEGQ